MVRASIIVLSQPADSLSTSLKSDVIEREMERESWTGASLFAGLKHRNQEKAFACSLTRVRESSTHLPAWSGAPATPYGRDSHHTMMRWPQSCSLLWILLVVDNIHVWTLCIKVFYTVDVTANLLYMSLLMLLYMWHGKSLPSVGTKLALFGL